MPNPDGSGGIERVGIVGQKRETVGQGFPFAGGGVGSTGDHLGLGEYLEGGLYSPVHFPRTEILKREVGDVADDAFVVHEHVAGVTEAEGAPYLAGVQQQWIPGSGGFEKHALDLGRTAVPYVQAEGDERLGLVCLKHCFNVRRRRTTEMSVVTEKI